MMKFSLSREQWQKALRLPKAIPEDVKLPKVWQEPYSGACRLPAFVFDKETEEIVYAQSSSEDTETLKTDNTVQLICGPLIEGSVEKQSGPEISFESAVMIDLYEYDLRKLVQAICYALERLEVQTLISKFFAASDLPALAGVASTVLDGEEVCTTVAEQLLDLFSTTSDKLGHEITSLVGGVYLEAGIEHALTVVSQSVPELASIKSQPVALDHTLLDKLALQRAVFVFLGLKHIGKFDSKVELLSRKRPRLECSDLWKGTSAELGAYMTKLTRERFLDANRFIGYKCEFRVEKLEDGTSKRKPKMADRLQYFNKQTQDESVKAEEAFDDYRNLNHHLRCYRERVIQAAFGMLDDRDLNKNEDDINTCEGYGFSFMSPFSE